MTTRGVFLLRLKMLCKPLDKKLFCFPFFSLTKPVSEGWWWKCWQNALAAKSFRVRYSATVGGTQQHLLLWNWGSRVEPCWMIHRVQDCSVMNGLLGFNSVWVPCAVLTASLFPPSSVTFAKTKSVLSRRITSWCYQLEKTSVWESLEFVWIRQPYPLLTDLIRALWQSV